VAKAESEGEVQEESELQVSEEPQHWVHETEEVLQVQARARGTMPPASDAVSLSFDRIRRTGRKFGRWMCGMCCPRLPRQVRDRSSLIAILRHCRWGSMVRESGTRSPAQAEE